MSGASDFGKDLGLMHEVVITGRKYGMGKEAWAKFAHDEDIARQVAELLEVNYTLTLEQMIAAGHYDWKNNDITSAHFSLTGSGTVALEWKLFHFDADISTEDAGMKIGQDDLVRPWISGKVEHLLSFGAKYPKEQRKYPIIGLGSVAQIGVLRDAPCLGRGGSERDLDRVADVWPRICRFLAVRPALVPSVI